MSTLKVDTILSSSGTTVSVPSGYYLNLAEAPVGAGASALLANQNGATTGDTQSSTVEVDIPLMTIRDADEDGTGYPDYMPYYSVSTRLTFTNGLLTDSRGGAGRFLKYVNRVYSGSKMAILSTGTLPGASTSALEFGQFNIHSFTNNGLNVFIDVFGLSGTVNGGAQGFTGDEEAKLFYVTGGNDASQLGVWMYHKCLDWFWFDPTHFRASVAETSIPGLWFYSPKDSGGTPFGWCFLKVIESGASAGGITPWVWSDRYDKWYLINDTTSTIFTQTGAAETSGNPVPATVPTTTVESPVETAAPTYP